MLVGKATWAAVKLFHLCWAALLHFECVGRPVRRRLLFNVWVKSVLASYVALWCSTLSVRKTVECCVIKCSRFDYHWVLCAWCGGGATGSLCLTRIKIRWSRSFRINGNNKRRNCRRCIKYFEPSYSVVLLKIQKLITAAPLRGLWLCAARWVGVHCRVCRVQLVLSGVVVYRLAHGYWMIFCKKNVT